jgi:hypothetical protein
MHKNNPQKVINLCISDCLVFKKGFNNFSSLIFKQFGLELKTRLTLRSLSYNN